jgi:hypothetical protein
VEKSAANDEPKLGNSAPAPADPVTNCDSQDEDRRRKHIRAGWVYGGIWIGIVAGFAVTASHVALAGFQILPVHLIFHLIWCSCLGGILGYNLCPVPRADVLSWDDLRFGTRALMVLVAYVGLLFGAGISSSRMAGPAHLYSGKYLLARQMAKAHRELARKAEAGAKQRLADAAELCAGRIPDRPIPGLEDFVRSLDQTVAADARKAVYDQFVKSEELAAQRLINLYRRRAEYFEALALKYDRARRRPWVPVAPDPTEPPFFESRQRTQPTLP